MLIINEVWIAHFLGKLLMHLSF